MKTTAEMIEVMQAFERGKEIQCCNHNPPTDWFRYEPHWGWLLCDYRIAEKPKKKVKMWLWVMKSCDGKYYRTSHYYADKPAGEDIVISKVESSMIEVEE